MTKLMAVDEDGENINNEGIELHDVILEIMVEYLG
jgi:hypothetical protein